MALAEVAGVVLGASLLGSPHCAGMCGGFVCFVSGGEPGPRRWLAQAAYHVGRVISYVSLGAAAGALGAGVEHAGLALGIGRVAPILAGFLLLVWGGLNLMAAVGRGPRWIGNGPHASPLGRWIGPWVRGLVKWPPAARGFAVGLLTTLIPCGFLYSFVAVAAGTGSALAGAGVLAIFWVGTVPILASLGFVADRVVRGLGARLPVLSASLLILLGLLTLTGRLMLPPSSSHHHHMAAGVSADMHAHPPSDHVDPSLVP